MFRLQTPVFSVQRHVAGGIAVDLLVRPFQNPRVATAERTAMDRAADRRYRQRPRLDWTDWHTIKPD